MMLSLALPRPTSPSSKMPNSSGPRWRNMPSIWRISLSATASRPDHYNKFVRQESHPVEIASRLNPAPSNNPASHFVPEPPVRPLLPGPIASRFHPQSTIPFQESQCLTNQAEYPFGSAANTLSAQPP